jgi:hypothetical protein
MRAGVLLLLAAAMLAQQPPASPNLRIHAELTSVVTTASAKPNDEVRLQVLEDVKGPDKKVLIPRDAKLTGHVSFVQKRGGQATQAALAILIDKAEWKEQSLPLEARVVTLESIGVDLMGQRVANPDAPTDKPGLEQPAWITAGRAGNTVNRGALPVPKDCGLENHPELGSVIFCDQQQVQLGNGARMVLRHGK